MCRMLSMYDVTDEDIDSVADLSQPSTAGQAPLEMQLPILELLKVYFLYTYMYLLIFSKTFYWRLNAACAFEISSLMQYPLFFGFFSVMSAFFENLFILIFYFRKFRGAHTYARTINLAFAQIKK